jgi:hypothetical protein
MLSSRIATKLEHDIKYRPLESREYGRRDPSSRPRDTLCPQKLALTSPTSSRYSSLADYGHGIQFLIDVNDEDENA